MGYWQKFTAREAASRPAQFAVAGWLAEQGNEVILMDRDRSVPNYHGPGKVDSGDILAFSAGLEGEYCIYEIKHRPKLSFSCADDFPYDTVFLFNKKAYDSKDYAPSFVCVVNADMTSMGVADTTDADQWGVKAITDRYYGTTYDAYECRPDQLEWITLG